MPKRTCLFFGNKGRGQQRVITNPKQKREVEKRETQYARNKININHAHAIRRSGIYSDRHVSKNEKNIKQKMHHEKLTCKAHEAEPSDATNEMTRLNNAAVSSFFVVCLNALIIRGRRMDRTCFPTGRASGLGHLDLVSKATTYIGYFPGCSMFAAPLNTPL